MEGLFSPAPAARGVGAMAETGRLKTLAAPAAMATVLVASLLLLLVSAGPARAATTFTVNQTGDQQDAITSNASCDWDPFAAGDQCTLRAAIQQANATAGADTIGFNIAGSGVHTITPSSALPEITEALTIDGYTQGDATASTSDDTAENTLAVGNDAVLRIELSGANAGQSANGLTLSETANDSAVRGLVINRFALAGINLGAADYSEVAGNFIGTDPTGTADLGNGDGSTGYPGVYVAGRSNTVGGETPATRNLISGNYEGVGIEGTNSTIQQNVIIGNYIGTDRSGTDKVGNFFAGVAIRGALYTFVISNVISGNEGNGVEAYAAGDPHNIGTSGLLANYIGTRSDGVGALGNAGNGVLLTSNSNYVGGSDGSHDPTVGNTIAFNGGDGVRVAGGTGNDIFFNSVFSNGGLGINLGEDGVTANDPGDGDTGPNDLQNFPVITSAKASRKGTTIKGTLNSTPSTTFTVQFFKTPKSTKDEGKTFIGEKSVSTGADGNVAFTFKPQKKVKAGLFVTATATNNDTGDTSELSTPRKVRRP